MEQRKHQCFTEARILHRLKQNYWKISENSMKIANHEVPSQLKTNFAQFGSSSCFRNHVTNGIVSFRQSPPR